MNKYVSLKLSKSLCIQWEAQYSIVFVSLFGIESCLLPIDKCDAIEQLLSSEYLDTSLISTQAWLHLINFVSTLFSPQQQTDLESSIKKFTHYDIIECICNLGTAAK